MAPLSDGRAVAIEVDRTDKSLDRLRNIVVTYAGEVKYGEVWFICATQLIYNKFFVIQFHKRFVILIIRVTHYVILLLNKVTSCNN